MMNEEDEGFRSDLNEDGYQSSSDGYQYYRASRGSDENIWSPGDRFRLHHRNRNPYDLHHFDRSRGSSPAEESIVTQIKRQLESQGYKVEVFSQTAEELLDIIINRESINGKILAEQIHENNFRFLSDKNPEHSSKISQALAEAIQTSKSISNRKASKGGVEKRKQNADEFAASMREVIMQLKTEGELKSQRDVVEKLNEKQVPTYRGGKWHLKTLQELLKRWKDLDV